MHKDLRLYEQDPAQDRQALERLAEWAERYSPIVSLEEGDVPQSLLLDITGCAACFHGEDQLAAARFASCAPRLASTPGDCRHGRRRLGLRE